jgi:hypothetical protein
MVTTKRKLPEHLIKAIHEDGELTDAQLIELITFEAEELGLTFDQAVELALARQLPKTLIGHDLQSLIWLLHYEGPCQHASKPAGSDA